MGSLRDRAGLTWWTIMNDLDRALLALQRSTTAPPDAGAGGETG